MRFWRDSRMQNEIEEYLTKAKEIHGDLCTGILMGTRMSLAGMRALGLDPKKRNRDLIVFVEVDRCMTDAVQAVTGCSLGHRNLKYFDYGKFAAVFYDTASNRAVRVSPSREREGAGDINERWRDAPENELLRLEQVSVQVREDDLPGKPKSRIPCSRCGEIIMDNRGVLINEAVVCRPCVEGAYYKPLEVEGTGSGGV